jgi:outer membrane receptor for ferrienterochelin and colicins
MFRPLGGERPLTVRASVAGGFRAPDFKELYLRFVNAAAGYAVNGNGALRPEHSVNTSADVEWAGRSIDVRASVFRNRIRDLIETVGPDADGTYTYDNVGLATTAGAELELSRRLARGDVGLGYSYLHTRDLSLGGPILGRAAHSGRATLGMEPWNRIRVALTALYTGEAPSARDDAGRVIETRRAFTQLNARVARAFVVGGQTAELSMGADNLFDARQGSDWPGFTGRQLAAGLSWIVR